MKLNFYDDFKKVLLDYKISERARQALAGLPLVLMVAPTSTGRNTMIRELLKTGKYYFVVSDTTRPPQIRDGKMEEHGVEYFFRSEEEVLNDLKRGEFLEAAIIHEQQVSGISIRELEKAKKYKKVAATDIEVIGTDNIILAKPDAVAVFLVPPSFEEWQKRLNSRGQMSPPEMNNRLVSAAKELKAALTRDYYHFVVADDLARTVPLVDKIAHGSNDQAEQQRGQALIKELSKELQQKLEPGLAN
ncbi:hypothetical protein HYW36_02570 [Candidatus Saccharibacteria bacterium]|nr:hypothetical protein [Candidatus Saccharibacteria bacterium]